MPLLLSVGEDGEDMGPSEISDALPPKAKTIEAAKTTSLRSSRSSEPLSPEL